MACAMICSYREEKVVAILDIYGLKQMENLT